MPQVVGRVIPEPEPFDRPIRRLTHETRVGHPTGLIEDGEARCEGIEVLRYRNIAPFSFFSVLQRGVTSDVTSGRPLVTDNLALQAQRPVAKIFWKYAERFTNAQPATRHQPHGRFQSRSDGVRDGLDFIEALEIPLVDRNH